MLWPIALKETAYVLNKLNISADERSNEARFFGIDGDMFDKSMFHVFGGPTFVLEAKLQSRVAGVPKWDPRYCMGIYVGHSPSHSGSVALVLNPKTGHVSPQYHVIFDESFTTVPYMNEHQVPPNWSDLVTNSRELVTDEQFDLAKTWLASTVSQEQEAPSGVHTMNNHPETSGSNLILDEQTLDVQTTINEYRNTDNSLENNTDTQTDRTSMQPFPSQQLTQLSPASEGDSVNKATRMINLETSGLRRSARLQEQTNSLTSDSTGPTITAYTTSSRNISRLGSSRTKKKLSFFSVFCSIRALWSFATSCMPHYHNNKCHFFAARISNDYKRVN